MKITNIFSSLRRITSKGDFIPEIDGLRLLALFPVILMHFNTNYLRAFGESKVISLGFLDPVVQHGDSGVFIFFAISGFILSFSFAKHFYLNKRSFNDLNLKGYYWRRLTRLEPPFLISTFAFYLLTGLFITHSLTQILPNLLATLTYSHYLVYGKWSIINPVTWSLEAEIQFYLLAPFICAFFFTLKEWPRNIILVVLIVLLPLLVYYSPESVFIKNRNISRTIPVYMSHFLVGVLLTSLYTGSLWSKVKKGQLLFDLLCVLGIIGIFSFYPSKKDVSNYLLFDLSLFLVMFSSFKGKFINKFFSNSLVTTIGGMCYSIYLIHYAMMYGLAKLTKSIILPNSYLNYGFHFILSISFLLIASTLFFKYCEKPFMYKDWPQKFVSFLKGRPTVSDDSKFLEKKEHTINR